MGRKEILDLVQIKNHIYAWSPRTLTRRLQYLASTLRIIACVDIDDVRKAVEKEMNGPDSRMLLKRGTGSGERGTGNGERK